MEKLCEERFEVLLLFSLEKRRLGENKSVFQYLKCIYGKDGWKYSEGCLLEGQKASSSRKSLCQGKFCLDASRKKYTKKKSTLWRNLNTGTRLSRKVVDYQCSWLDLSRPWITTEAPLWFDKITSNLDDSVI